MGKKDRKDKPKPAADAGEGKGEDYTFALPDFDERAFMTREIQSARATFIGLGLGAAAGLLARLLQALTDVVGGPWLVGFLPIAVAIWWTPRLAVRFGEERVEPDWKMTLGNGFIVFFTGLAVWVLLLNEPFP